jgi:hypothetical protein
MPDPTQNQTAGQVLAGQNAPQTNPDPGMPLYARAGQPATLPGQPAQPQPQPTPQQAVAAKHHAIGKAASFLFGQQHDDNGQEVRQRPGDVFRSLLLGAMLGGSLGSQGNAGGGGVGSFLGGMGRGAAGVEQQQYARQQQEQDRAMKRQQLTLEQQREQDEHMVHQASVAHLTAAAVPGPRGG